MGKAEANKAMAVRTSSKNLLGAKYYVYSYPKHLDGSFYCNLFFKCILLDASYGPGPAKHSRW